LEITPYQFRLAVAAGEDALLGYPPTPGERARARILKHAGNEDRCNNLLESLHWLVVANNILETQESRPRDAFKPRSMVGSSLHILIIYSDERTWRSSYGLNELPQNVASLVEQARYLALQEFDRLANASTEAS
jgi:hypothetical protein